MSESAPLPEFLTTKEVAELLRLKERKVYELASLQEIPCRKATGKLLFPRKELMHWLNTGELQSTAATARPAVAAGSHDPLLEWAIRESGCGLATTFDGSLAGLQVFEEGQAQLTGLHLPGTAQTSGNVPAVQMRFAKHNAVLVHWATRQQGLLVAKGNPLGIAQVSDLKTCRVALRQTGAGGMLLLQQLLGEAGIAIEQLTITEQCRTENEAIAAVASGNADAAPGLEALARVYGLGFVPTQTEHFDLLVCRKAWFDPPVQTLLGFARSPAFLNKASQMAGYDTSGLGQVVWTA
ncbi:substrate-binding domain-containing protein [Limnobacter sp.]|uniref:substrate-binding domain-containing protein n=1 Tax=Limnobacter sp. TaxID=2003368 RepID=UPI0035199F07